ncbi:hypothetical protein LWF15_33380 [Kineosporia rhizophila]|uniref:hypothetical protein n=1 Tax=Kineosporia rhizophila TaxID=84633 RepID=UPI000ABAA2C1|nr:hypothetical protein [Kineosporia rhizophila]MCE0540397.1 hypothetical protein [Kineosporia rhizophila]
MNSTVLASGFSVLRQQIAPTPNVPDPGLGQAPPELSERVDTVLALVAYLGVAACVAGFVGVAIAMAVTYRRGEIGEHAMQFFVVLVASSIVGSASSIAAFGLG